MTCASVLCSMLLLRHVLCIAHADSVMMLQEMSTSVIEDQNLSIHKAEVDFTGNVHLSMRETASPVLQALNQTKHVANNSPGPIGPETRSVKQHDIGHALTQLTNVTHAKHPLTLIALHRARLDRFWSAITNTDMHALMKTAPFTGFILGCLYSFTPDHLAMLLTITAGVRPERAFALGAHWGAGHSVGMVVVFAVFLLANKFVNVEVWEFYGNYCAGALLVIMGLYFMFRENQYIENHEDGSASAKFCGCCAPVAMPPTGDEFACSPCRDQSQIGYSFVTARRSNRPAPEAIKPIFSTGDSIDTCQRNIQGAIIGVLQGLCCPSCVVYFGFVGTIASFDHSWKENVGFLITYAVTSSLVNGILASLWSTCCFSDTGSKYISTRGAYRFCCGIAVMLGLAWITLNATGYIKFVDYGDKLAVHFGASATAK